MKNESVRIVYARGRRIMSTVDVCVVVLQGCEPSTDPSTSRVIPSESSAAYHRRSEELTAPPRSH